MFTLEFKNVNLTIVDMNCYPCQKPLQRHLFRSHFYWRCPKCLGAFFQLAVLEKIPEARVLLPHLKPPKNDPRFSSRLCSLCQQVMRSVLLEDHHSIRLEVCDQCRFVWFEKEEYQLSPSDAARFAERTPLSVKKPPALKPKKMEEKENPILSISVSDPEIDSLSHELFKLPMVENNYQYKWESLIVPTLLVLCFVFSFSYDSGAEKLGFNNADPGRLRGLTWISSLFVHRGFWHLISNSYFIYQFGRVLEDLLGPVRFLLLFLLGGASGNLMMLLLAPKGQLVVGASGAVMALMTYYACTFPRTRMIFIRTLFFGWYGHYDATQIKVKFNVWIVLLSFLAIDYIGSKSQIEGLSSISHLSHLGGALAGFLIWFSDKTSKV